MAFEHRTAGFLLLVNIGQIRSYKFMIPSLLLVSMSFSSYFSFPSPSLFQLSADTWPLLWIINIADNFHWGLRMGSLTKKKKTGQTLFLTAHRKNGFGLLFRRLHCSKNECVCITPQISFPPLTLCGSHPSFQRLCTYLCQNEERRAVE